MKNLTLKGLLLIIASSFLLIQCTTDPLEGVAGQNGIDGIAGVDGIDGVDGTTSCTSCHANSHTDPIIDAYALSRHATGSNWARGTSASCAQCHNNEGYIDYLSGTFVDDDGVQSANPNGYAVSNPITCTGCHSNHRSFDFENDGNDYALRNIDPVFLVIDPTVHIDFANDVDPLGLSNSCTTCHQPRNSYAIPAGTEDYEITSSRFGPHHSPQATLVEGIMGANIAGAVGYPGVGSSAHRAGSSCTACHMGETTDGTDGGHSWMVTSNTCLECHSNVPTEVTGFAADMLTLHTLLVEEGAITEDGSTVSGTYPVKVAQATWNYKTLEEDKSHGVHNPNYAKALLKNSIEALQN